MANRIYKLLFFLIAGLSLSAQNCDLPVALSDDCASAPIFCGETLDNYCSSTGAPNTFNPSISNGCSLENSIWVQIPVCQTEVNLSIIVDNCQLGTGIEVMLASSTDCQSFTAENPGCFSLNPNSQTDIQFSNLTPDSLYYLIIDGDISDLCDFTVEVIGGIAGFEPANCDSPVALSDSCANAPIFYGEELNNYCSSTGAPNTFNPIITNGCSLENSIWVQVPVAQTELNLSIQVDNCQLGNGLNVMLAGSTDCQNFSAQTPGCFSLNPDSLTVIQFTNLTPDELYYLIIDGDISDLCDFTIAVIDGIEVLDTSATSYMWQVITPAYIEGDPNACTSNGQYRLVPAVCELVEGNCATGGGTSGSRMAGCDVPGELCPPPTQIQYDTIVHWNIPPCIRVIGDTTTLDIELDFSDYLQCYIESGQQPWPIDSIPFSISVERELIPIPDTTNSDNIYCDCSGSGSGSGGQICGSCASGAGLDGWLPIDIFLEFYEVCPPCDNTPIGFYCAGDQFMEFPDACTVIITEVFPLPDNPIDFGVITTCPGECVDVDTETFCGEGTYNWQTINQFGCEVPATVTIVSPTEISITGNGGTITCYEPTVTICAMASGGMGNYTYDWYWFGLGFGSCATVSYGGNYTCIVTDDLGCSASLSFTVDQDNSWPAAIIQPIPTDTLDDNVTSIQLFAHSSNINNFYWQGAQVSSNSAISNIITVTEPGVYMVTVTDYYNGCSSEASITIYSNYTSTNNLFTLGDSCTYAPYFCAEFLDDAFSNNQNATSDNLDLIPGCPMDNSLWLSFSTCDTMAQLSFFVDSCAQAQGLEFSIVSTVDCDTFNVVGTPCQTVANGSLDTLTFDSLEIGNIYYLIIDGIDADICDFEIGVIGGIAGGLDSIPPPDSLDQFHLEQLTDGSIAGPTPVCAFTQATYTFNPGTCAVLPGDCNLVQGNPNSRADAPCNNGCFNIGNIELDTIVDWTLPNGTIVHGDSTDFDITLEFGLDFLLDQYNGMIPTSDTDTIVITLFADYSIIPINDTITQDTLGAVYCHCPLGIICGSCVTSASFDVQVIIIFDNDARTTCVDECQDACGQELCPGESVYCTGPCILTTVSLTLVPVDQTDWIEVIDCFSPCVNTPYGQFCDPGIFIVNEDCAVITITIITDFGNHTSYPPETICPGECVTVGTETFCTPGDHFWFDLNNCDTYSVQVTESNPAPIDYGTVVLCPNECFTSNDGQQFCTAGVHNFIESDANGCQIDAMVNIEFNNVSDVDLGTEFICDGDCYNSSNGPLCTPGIQTWTEIQNGCTVNYTIDIQFFNSTPIDYGTIVLCPGDCFTANSGQQFCTLGVNNFNEIDQNGCNVNATVEIIIETQASLSIGILSKICSPTSAEYNVSFTIYGDQPFSVNGVEIAGDFYSSSNILSGNSYSFEVKNSQAQCPSTEFVNGSYSCPLLCTSNAGALITTPNNLCTSQELNINETNPVVLQSADFDFEYLIHTDPDPLIGSVLMRNKTGVFSYDASIFVIENEYFTSRVVGMVVNNEVDLSGNCINFTSGPSIKYYADPTLSIIPNNDLTLDCNQPTIDLTAEAAGGSGQWAFNWSGGSVASSDPTITVNQSGFYICGIIDQVTGCEALSNTDVFADFEYPQGFIISPQGMLDCSTNEMELTASLVSTNNNLDISWTGPEGLINTADPLNIMALEAGWYFLNIDNPQNGCSITDSVEVIENSDVPTEIITDINQPDCFDEPFGSLNIIDVEGGTGPYEFHFENQITNGQINNLSAGNYTVSVVDQNGCDLIQEIEIIAPAGYESNLAASINVNYGETTQLDAQLNFEPYLITWIDAAGNTLSNEEVWNLDFFETQRISLHAVDQNGCAVEAEVQILVKALEPGIYIPNVFSPNGDKLNDEFEIFGNESIAKINMLRIFDRWGSLVFKAENYILGADEGKWDGRALGKKSNPGVFIYETTFTLIDGQKGQKSGDVVLLK